jgi:hypothetical protein
MTAGPGGASALAWMRGRYTTYTDYRLEVVGVVRRANGSTVATGPAGPRLSVVAGIAAPPVLDTAGVPLAGDFDAHPADDFSLYRGGTAREDLVIGDDGGWPVFAQARQVSGSGYRPVAGDFDGDGDDDVLWHGPGTALDSLWLSRPDGTSANAPVTQVGGTYTPLAGDYDADGDDDILWYAPGTTAERLWVAQAGGYTSRSAPAANGTYRPVALDLDGNGAEDVLWYGVGARSDHLWSSGPTPFARRTPAPVAL